MMGNKYLEDKYLNSVLEDYFSDNQGSRYQEYDLTVEEINSIFVSNDIAIDDEKNPVPGRIRDTMLDRYIYIMLEDAMILSEPDGTHLTIFNPDEELLDLITEISSSEGLFVWKSNEDEC